MCQNRRSLFRDGFGPVVGLAAHGGSLRIFCVVRFRTLKKMTLTKKIKREMEKLLKMTIALIMGLGLFGFQSCGNDDKEDNEPFQTSLDFSKKDAVIGKWFQTLLMAEDGSTTKSEDRIIIFNSDGSFEYWWGTGSIYHASGTYSYSPESKDRGIAYGTSSSGGEFTFTFENYQDYRYKVSIHQPPLSGVVNVDAVGIFGKTDK